MTFFMQPKALAADGLAYITKKRERGESFHKQERGGGGGGVLVALQLEREKVTGAGCTARIAINEQIRSYRLLLHLLRHLTISKLCAQIPVGRANCHDSHGNNKRENRRHYFCFPQSLARLNPGVQILVILVIV